MITRRITRDGHTSLKVFRKEQPRAGVYTIHMLNGHARITTPLLHDPISVDDARRVAGEYADVAEIAARFEAEQSARLAQ